jgi:[ribosomal protein S5]-alanine N-acetyltransferase
MTTLQTERLVPRNINISDWEPLHEMIEQYESSELAAYDHTWPTAPEEIIKITEWFAQGDSYLAVCLKESDRFIGFVALNQEQKQASRVFNLGYVFNFSHHGKGYATEGCRAVLDHAFCRLRAQRVVSGTAAANAPSCRLLERLGFKWATESLMSFRNAQDGTPKQFVGRQYELAREEWDTLMRSEPSRQR